jgi:hypothetical protein
MPPLPGTDFTFKDGSSTDGHDHHVRQQLVHREPRVTTLIRLDDGVHSR